MSKVLDQANDIVTEYSFSNLKKAVARAEWLRDPKANTCRCKSCMHSAVSEANKWIAFTEDSFVGETSGRYEVERDKKGKLEVIFISHRI